MDIKAEKLRKFFEEVKTLTFWKRLFGWSKIKELSYDAYEEFKSLTSSLSQLSQKNNEIERNISVMKKDDEHLKTRDTELSVRVNHIERENNQLKEENTILKQKEENRVKEHDKAMSTLTSIREKIENDRRKEIDEQQKKELERITQLKETWANHEINVKEIIKSICQKNTIEYVEKVPFRGSPDNTIKIANEFVIFDAKSPASDDLSNFPTYIKSQTELVKKYIKEESVMKDIFLVIPSNTVDVIDQFSFNMADYDVYVVTLDALEPIILGLKKLEEYEFIEQLSPEERDDICRVIGKFAHLTKRRIQIDQFFTRQFLDILSKSESELPKEIFEKAVEYERSEKLNPPQEKRVKLISGRELEVDSHKIDREAEAKDIALPTESIQQNIKSLPLYTENSKQKLNPHKPRNKE